MKKISTMICIGLTLCGTSVFAKGMDSSMNMKNKMGDNAVFIESKDIDWKNVEGFDGLQTAVVEGDAMKGAHHSFMKFKPGFSAPLHHHTANHYMTVVAGTLVLTENGVEHRLPAGSYFSFKNKTKHTTMCAQGAECILFGDVRGKWDVVPEKNNMIGSK